MRKPILFALLGALFSPAGMAQAQDDMSVEEIRNAFQRQVEAFSNVKTRGLGGSQDRGLKLITVDDIKTDDQGEQVVVTTTATTPADTVTGTTSQVATASDTAGDTASVSGSDTSDGTTPLVTLLKPDEPTDTTDTTGTTDTAASSGATITATATGTEPTDTSSASDGTVIKAAADPFKPLVYGQFRPELQVNLHIEFGFDSAALDSSQKPKLDKMCVVLQTSPIHKIRIVGHTDASGSDEYNERLSILRAREVARHLTEECGIGAERLETLGLGERFPFNQDDPKADENRRVEFQALS